MTRREQALLPLMLLIISARRLPMDLQIDFGLELKRFKGYVPDGRP